MTDREKYTFHIDAYSPESIPMARLADYLSQLAGLLGNVDSVHFVQVDGGSVNLVHEVEYEAVPKVRDRLRLVNDLDVPEDVQKRYKLINEMLRDDNTVGTLKTDTENILRFPGKEIPRPKKIGPFSQQGSLDGVLIRIGGKDKTVHAQLADHSGEVRSCIVNRDMARDMAHHLFGAPLRVVGAGRWERDEDGQWTLISFRANEFVVLSDDDLQDVVNRLQAITENNPDRPDDPIEVLSRIRGDDEIH